MPGLPRQTWFIGLRLPHEHAGTTEPGCTAMMTSLERRRPGDDASMQACCEGPK